MKIKINVNRFDETFKIAFSIFAETFMKVFHMMDLLKIFRMQEPVPKDLLPKNSEVGQYKEVVQEKDVLLRNSKARIRELEQQIADLGAKNKEGVDSHSQNLINEYEAFYLKIMTESQHIIDQKNDLEAKLKEMELFCHGLFEKYEKAKNTLYQYENAHEKLKDQIQKYEEIISSLTEEYNKLKDYMHKKIDQTESKLSFNSQGRFEELLIKNEMQKEYCKSMFEPLKGLDN